MKKKFGIIGNPIKHSLSPILHNYWFEKYGLEATYTIFEAEDKDLKNIINKIRDNELTGLNVTLPFKQKIINLTDKIVNDAEMSGSVNTILFENGKVVGENTDVFGLQAAYLKEIDNCDHKSTLIIGAGGVSPSVILSLKKSGVKKIFVTNRTNEKCIFLKNKFNFINILPWDNLKSEIKKFDIIINATSLGLNHDDKFHLDFTNIGKNKFFYDVIYNPSETNFLKEAKLSGNKTENGKMMFIYQAHQSFALWNRVLPKIDEETKEILK